MIFTDYLENIAKPNHKVAQQNLHSPTPCPAAVLTIPRNRPKTIRQTNDLTLYLSIFSFRHFVILLMSSEAEAGSAEEQPAKE